METHLKESMTAGVVVEIHDGRGEFLGQAVFFDYRGRPLPAVGDTLRCEFVSFATGREEQVLARVRSRHFDVQRQDNGEPCVWARLDVEQVETQAVARRGLRTPRFSTN